MFMNSFIAISTPKVRDNLGQLFMFYCAKGQPHQLPLKLFGQCTDRRGQFVEYGTRRPGQMVCTNKCSSVVVALTVKSSLLS